ncbi:Titin [Diplonema papillatum]|nr:Titin [Diplonema papillatum]
MDKCATVAHLMACTDTAMTLRWAEDDELQHYLEWRSAASDAWTGCVVTSPALRTSLKPDTAYSLRMRCRRKGSMKWSEPSLPQVFKTPCLLPMPLQPHTIRAERVTHSTAVISWDLEENVPDGCMNEIVRYRVCLNKVSAKTLEEEEGEEGYCTSCSCAFEGLKPGTEYAASVSRMNASRLWSAALPHLVFRTEFTTPASVELENIEALPTDGDEMTLRWIAPRRNGADILGYDIAVTRLSTRDERTERTGPRSEVVLKDLSPDSWYSIRLRANNAMGPADWSQPLEVKTNAPTFLTPSISLVDAQADSLTVAWERPDCHKQAVDTYTLQMSRGSTVFADLASFDAMASTCYSHRHGPLPAYTKVTYRLTCTSSRCGSRF